MIIRLNKLKTGISCIQEIPSSFFSKLEAADKFDDSLFPNWSVIVFKRTDLFKKFEAVFDKYKSLADKSDRDKVVAAFDNSNKIENLCNNTTGTLIIELKDLSTVIINEVDSLFLYLYNSAINYKDFETYAKDTVKESIDRFITDNSLEVCPFCGLEGFLNLEGQSRIALDHWLCKDLFPMSAVNFDNLFPIGSKCNERPAKGSKNILIDSPATKVRVKAFYPYSSNDGVDTSFTFVNEPQITGITDADWEFKINPTNPSEQDVFISWDSTLNIKKRYLDYFRKNIFPMWESDYKRFIEEDHDIEHATTVVELKANFRIWKASFPLKGRPGAILYRSFIMHLINHASEGYLYGLCENFKRKIAVDEK